VAAAAEPLATTRIWVLVAEVPATQETYTIPGQKPGTYKYTATHVDINGEESRNSGIATKTVTSFKAAAGSTVYQVSHIDDDFWLLPIGTVTADTECDPDKGVNGLHVVPVSAVTWDPGTTARPQVLVAQCQ
jgi:hypothetical protein